ncbi:MAG: TA system VapC family ribonuclease toxin [Natronosporangium sp.]
MVYLCDTNVWLALAISGHVHHPPARAWLETVEEPESIQFCRATQQSFLRLLTTAAVLAPYGSPPLTNEEAWAAYEAFADDDRVVLRAAEPAGIGPRWRHLAVRSTASPKLWMDSYLAAFAIASSSRMVTTDLDFRQYADLDLVLLGRG